MTPCLRTAAARVAESRPARRVARREASSQSRCVGARLSASHVGTWADDRVCSACGESSAPLVEPLQIEWEEGTARIGDFSWCGYSCVVTDEVRQRLEHDAFECRFGRVEVQEPAAPSSRPRVAFAYRGSALSWLMPTARVPLDVRASEVELKSECRACGQ
jgi:hypothetical protein